MMYNNQTSEVDMKCAACGYEHRIEFNTVDKVIRYQSGKRKGEVKEITTETLEFKIGDEDFIQLEFKKDVDELGHRSRDYYNDYFTEKTLYACPECGTVKIMV